MRNEIVKTVKQRISEAAIGMALQVTKAPNQSCTWFLGEPHSDLVILPEDYKSLRDFIKNNRL